MFLAFFLGPLVLGMGCEDDAETYTLHCDLGTPVLNPATAAPGQSVAAAARALTTVQDTVVRVGATEATVSEVQRPGCDDCDQCRTKSECTRCDDCDACAADCAECVESAVFAVPMLADGSYGVTITNVHGQSPVGTLLVARNAGDDTGDGGEDSGSDDSGD
ncbi:MAG: hypothetical protein FJ090_21360 [Deltaproteobacteria bacterium]|nr:hypothetical protein [Deltaproteobacteria bacterium]